MARITSAFSESFRKEEDRIDRKRKENREAFEKYREMRVKNGDQVTAQDFQNYRMSWLVVITLCFKAWVQVTCLKIWQRELMNSLANTNQRRFYFAEARKKTYGFLIPLLMTT